VSATDLIKLNTKHIYTGILFCGNHIHWFVCISWFFFNTAQIRLRDYGSLDFDSVDARRQPPVDTTWQQVSHIFTHALNFQFVLNNQVEQ